MADAPETASSERDRFNNTIAILVALISAFLAVASVKGGNIGQAIQRTQAVLTDGWNQYQAKRMRHFELDLEIRRGEVMARDGIVKDSPENRELMESWRRERERYSGEMKELMEANAGLAADLKRYNEADDVFDFSESFLSLSLALLAVAALTRMAWLLALAAGVSLVGLGFGLAGFAGYTTIRPEWLATLLGA